ncbi:polysaccharide pyruvyl transferase family protein [Sphingomonas sp. SUN019]|uniref:polysaccharide pyruvyl transferase family protein n=1 Tax=Sphingomonas sp. SUN019 TaxID=2937788 RepID=UPI00216416C1|nr:polysaccharide pyruvyl transferase family protein [Sphingomonas sp. SUN019]UVO48990.1 polysaccharide pyruvyl transferase family protein [Sphingomonas sp. SUN019]
MIEPSAAKAPKRVSAPVGRGRPPRLLFHRLGDRSGSVLGAAETVGQLREEVRTTSLNVGNLVHLEAPAKLLRYNRRTPQFRQTANSPEAFAAIDRQYDGIVLGYANMIRNYDHLDEEARDTTLAPLVRETEWLEQTRCKIYAMGIGIQDQLPPRADAIDPRLFTLLKLLNDRAEIFAVRGAATEAWLHAVGLTNAVALGCPSMFIYPRNAMSIRPPVRDRALRIATAGRLQRNRDDQRVAAINRVGAAFDSSYVFQNDFYAMFRGDGDEIIYNDATGEVDAEAVRARGRAGLDVDLTFADYRLFRSTEKWRGFAIGQDAYFGDRFHGGVVFLQCGKPAIIVQNDARVKELTALYDIPTATSDQILSGDPIELLHDRLSAANLRRFRETYLGRYRDFQAALRGVGLEQFQPIDADDLADLI